MSFFFLQQVEWVILESEEFFWHRLVKVRLNYQKGLYNLNGHCIPTLSHRFQVPIESDFKLLRLWVVMCYYGAFHTLVQGSVFEKMVTLFVEQCDINVKPTEVTENIFFIWNSELL